MPKAFDLTVKRSYSEKCVGFGVAFSGYGEPWISGKMTGSLPVADARALAAALLAEADRVDAIDAKKAARNERRAKWREKEIAAGRMVSLAEIFGERR